MCAFKNPDLPCMAENQQTGPEASRLANVSRDISAILAEVSALKRTLSSNGQDGAESGYLGLVSPRDRQALLQLLLSAAQQLDRLREKEIELLRLERSFMSGGDDGSRASLRTGEASL